jgi:hypothetical protein
VSTLGILLLYLPAAQAAGDAGGDVSSPAIL